MVCSRPWPVASFSDASTMLGERTERQVEICTISQALEVYQRIACLHRNARLSVETGELLQKSECFKIDSYTCSHITTQ
jgi:hypothetical protein